VKSTDLLGSELLRELIAIKTDTMWRMLALSKEGRLPARDQEGATGAFDNKGAIFVPGGLVFEDSDRKPVEREKHSRIGAGEFRHNVRIAMRYDNATLIYPDGMALGVNLDNGFFADIAATILANKTAAMKRRPVLESRPIPRIYSDDITRSHAPTYLEPPYGSRTKLSSCIAVCLTEPRMYYVACCKEFGLRGEEARGLWEGIRKATRSITGRDEVLLAPPYVVVCHTARYRNRNLAGLTRILGFGKFGEFATFTLEKVQKHLVADAGLDYEDLDARYLFADFEGTRVVGVLRIYSATQPGKRKKKTETFLAAPEELGIDLTPLSKESKERYRIAD
jgi:hypothetical protein